MGYFTKESLEHLRQSIDLVEVIGSHIDLKRSGATYKALCPFHDEKTSSFIVRKGDSHYHCFGCGVHGDAIQFLMSYLSMSFSEAVESLAERFNIRLEMVDGEDDGPNIPALKDAMEWATRVYQFALLHTDEGHDALKYLYQRGITIDFIRKFRIGLATKSRGVFRKMMNSKRISNEILEQAGLIVKKDNGDWRDFFFDRITFPINNATGAVIGFSARKYNESTFGGKYINTAETPLFKKSRTLYGLNYCRRRIAKERRAVVVEGQIDALQLIHSGLDIAVAPLGTAFGEEHVGILADLGVNAVYLAMDADDAGTEAARKTGNILQRKGIEVYVTEMPAGFDPDTMLSAQGAEGFLKALRASSDYLTFLTGHIAGKYDLKSPAVKSEVVGNIVKMIREWEDPLMVHESLRKLAHLMRVPEDMVGVGGHIVRRYIKKMASAGTQDVDPDRILEGDLLRLMLVAGEHEGYVVKFIRDNISYEDFKVVDCKKIYQVYLNACDNDSSRGMLDLAISLDTIESQGFLADIASKKINVKKIGLQTSETVQRILDRNWLLKREEVRTKIHSGQYSDDKVMDLVKEFDALKSPPKIGNCLP